MKPMPILTAIVLALALTACGGDSSSRTLVTPPPVIATLPPAMDFTAVDRAIDAAPVADMAIMIGDSSGVIHVYEKGSFSTGATIRIASATKLITGVAIWRLIEAGELELSTRPATLISFWNDPGSDLRGVVTLEQLMSFTSGFNERPTGGGCPGDGALTLDQCVQEIYDDRLDTEPGRFFAYGPEHMQIAALMAREATGADLKDFMRTDIFDPLGVSDATQFPANAGANVRYSGSLNSTADDYACFLTALLRGDLVNDIDAFLTDRTSMALFDYRIPAITENNLDWHYGFSFWKECDLVSYTDLCDAERIISSPGAFGFTPWVDFENSYWAIIAMDENLTPSFRPSRVSVSLEQQVQPLIETAMNP